MAGPYLVVRLDSEHADELYGVLDLADALPRLRAWVSLANQIKRREPYLSHLTFADQLSLHEDLDLDTDDQDELDDNGWILLDDKPTGKAADEEYDHLKVYPDGDFWFEAVARHSAHAVESQLFPIRDFDDIDPDATGWRP